MLIPAFAQSLLFLGADEGVLYGLVRQLPEVLLTQAESLRGDSVLF